MAIVRGETSEEDEADSPQHKRDGNCNRSHYPGVHDRVSLSDATGGGLGENRAPVPKGDDVSLLGPLDDAGTVNPCFDGGTT